VAVLVTVVAVVALIVVVVVVLDVLVWVVTVVEVVLGVVVAVAVVVSEHRGPEAPGSHSHLYVRGTSLHCSKMHSRAASKSMAP
jgi:hypothetical protein